MQLLRSLFDSAVSGRVRLLRAALLLLLLLLAACGYRVWLVFRYNPLDHIWSDPARHWEAGINALSSAPMTLIDPVIYQIYIGILAKLTLKVLASRLLDGFALLVGPVAVVSLPPRVAAHARLGAGRMGAARGVAVLVSMLAPTEN